SLSAGLRSIVGHYVSARGRLETITRTSAWTNDQHSLIRSEYAPGSIPYEINSSRPTGIPPPVALTCIGGWPGGRGPAPAHLDPARDLLKLRTRDDAVADGGPGSRLFPGPPVEAGQQARH